MRQLVSVALAVALLAAPALAAPAKHSSLSPRLHEAVDAGRARGSDRHRVVVGLELRNREQLDAFLADVHDPASPSYGRFLTQDEFNALYAPTPEDEAAVVRYLRGAGVKVTERTGNRLIVGGVGSVAALERAFGVEIHDVVLDGNKHYAATTEPSFPAELAATIVGVTGLDDLAQRRPQVHSAARAAAPRAALGSNCCHLSPNDVYVLYGNTATTPGAGQTIVIAGAYAWKDTDNTNFNAEWGLPALPLGSGQVCTGPAGSTGCAFNNQQSIEIALDVEYSHGTAPMARILNYMSASTSLADFTTAYNRIVTDNPGHVVTTSWGLCETQMSTSTQQTDDNVFANGNAIGQSWFAASGDGGSRDCGTSVVTVDNPANSPHVMGVGGTTPTCSNVMTSSSPGCAGYGSETGWSGSGGGTSQVFLRPGFQTGCGVPAGSQRLVPDVALEADTSPGNYVAENGSWWIVGGTSGAAPQWAGLFAELNQRRGGNGVGNPGALLYGLCGTSAFHDVTSGSNTDFTAGPGYDRVTGLGTFDAANLLAAAGGTTTTTTAPSTTTTLATTTTVPTTTTLATTTTVVATTTTKPSTTTTTVATTTTTKASTTTTTTIPACLRSGASCTQASACCSGSCRGKPGTKTCK